MTSTDFSSLLLLSFVAVTSLWTYYWDLLQSRRTKPKAAPTVKSLTPWLGGALRLAWNMPGFLNECFHLYGPNFQIIAAGMPIVFVSDKDSLDAFYRNREHALLIDKALSLAPHALGDVKSPQAAHFIETTLIPVIVRGNAEPSLCEMTPIINKELYVRLTALSAASSEGRFLWPLVTHTLFHAIMPAMFGSAFPLHIYDDLIAIDKSTYQLFHSIPLLSNSIPRARLRMRDALKQFMRPWKTTPGDIPSVSAHGNEVVRTLLALDLTDDDRAGLLLTYVWGVVTNLFRLTYWLLAHLAVDRAAYAALQSSIDTAVAAEFGDLSGVLAAHPRAVNGPHFALLDSAIKETGRLHLLPQSYRVAQADVILPSARGPFIVPQGTQVVAYTTGAHHDSARFDDAHRFHIDRFVGGQNVTNLYLWAKGPHICPGRHMAMYYTKMLVVLLLHRFDLIVADSSKPLQLPDGNPWSMGFPLPKKDLLVSVKERA